VTGDDDWRGRVKIAFLTNMVPPYHKPVLKLLTQRYGGLRIFISTAMEANRPWKAEWKGLDVVVQKGLAVNQSWRHPKGFREAVTVHIPLDTISQLARYRPDVVMSGEMGTRTLLAFIYRKLTGSCKLLIWSEVTKTTEQGRGVLRSLLRKALAQRVDGILALGTGGADYIRSLGVAEDKIFRLAYTTDIERFTCLSATRVGAAARRLLYAGQLVQRKGLMPFLATMSRWASAHPEEQIEFMVAGNGPLEDELRALPVPNNVKLIFRGAVQYEDLPELYGQAGIFVMPTLADTWGVVVNEALASAVPVMGSLCSQAVEEMIEDGKTGWTFRPQVEDEVYSAIDRALLCPEEDLDHMRSLARRRALGISPEYVADLIDRALAVCSAEALA
jgi:hypothetical protein